MAVDLVVMPDHLALGFRGGPTWSTDKLSMVNGQERRFMNRSVAQHVYVFRYSNQTREYMTELRNFHYDRRGDFYPFLMKDYADFEATNELFALGDGAAVRFPLIRTYTAGFNPYERTIRHPVVSTVTITVNGVPSDAGGSPSPWSIDATTGEVVFAAPPALNDLLRWSGQHLVPVRFEGDRLTFINDYTDHVDAMSVEDLTAIEVIP